MSDMTLRPRTREGETLARSLSMYDTNKLLYEKVLTKRRRVSYRAKYKGNFNGGGVGLARKTRT